MTSYLAESFTKNNGLTGSLTDSDPSFGYAIHGIRPEAQSSWSYVVAFGELFVKLYAVTEKLPDELSFELRATYSQSEWVWDALPLGPTRLLLGLAHNTVALLDHRSGQVLSRWTGPSSSLLYSLALFPVHDSDRIWVASGSTLSQGLVWSFTLSTPSVYQQAGQLTGQSGVLMRLRWFQRTPPAKRARHVSLCLAAASDDRSVALYSLPEPLDPSEPLAPLVRLIGHQARVWDVCPLPDLILTCGEDYTTRAWSYTGELLAQFTGHYGKNVWRLAVSPDAQWLATGGTDTTVRLHRLDLLLAASRPQASSCFVRGRLRCFAEGPRSGHYLNEAGEVYSVDWTTFESAFVCRFPEPNGLQCLAVTHSETGPVVAAGDALGRVWLSAGGEVTPLLAHAGLVSKVWLGLPHADSLVSSDCAGNLSLWSLATRTCVSLLWQSNAQAKAKGRASARSYHSLCWLPALQRLAVGDSLGGVGLLAVLPIELQLLSLLSVHDGQRVTSLVYHTPSETMFSAGRDGSISRFQIHEDRLVRLSVHRAFKNLKFVEELFFSPTGELLLFGLYGQHSIIQGVLSPTVQFIQTGVLATKRPVQFLPARSPAGYLLCLPKQSELLLWRPGSEAGPNEAGLLTSLAVGHRPLHGSECLAALRLGRLLITAGEDTTVRTFSLPDLQPRQLVSEHVAAVRCLATASHGGCSWLVSGGGRGQLWFWTLAGQPSPAQAEKVTLGQQLDTNTPEAGQAPLLGRQFQLNMNSAKQDLRVMAVDLISLSGRLMCAAARSDGVLQILEVFEDSTRLLCECSFSSAVLCLCFALPGQWPSWREFEGDENVTDSSPDLLLLTGQSGGDLAVVSLWLGLAGPQMRVARRGVHQGGINALLLVQEKADVIGGTGAEDGATADRPELQDPWVLYTASEDQRVGRLPLVSPLPSPTFLLAHSSAVKALASDPPFLFSVGLDQRLVMSRVNAAATPCWTVSQQRFVELADCSTLLRVGPSSLLVLGTGVQQFSF